MRRRPGHSDARNARAEWQPLPARLFPRFRRAEWYASRRKSTAIRSGFMEQLECSKRQGIATTKAAKEHFEKVCLIDKQQLKTKIQKSFLLVKTTLCDFWVLLLKKKDNFDFCEYNSALEWFYTFSGRENQLESEPRKIDEYFPDEPAKTSRRSSAKRDEQDLRLSPIQGLGHFLGSSLGRLDGGERRGNRSTPSRGNFGNELVKRVSYKSPF